jgi:hypothetical protein
LITAHSEDGSGETLAGMLRTGSAGANRAADHIVVLDAALAQLPERERGNVLVRTDTGGGVKDLLHHITGLELEYSVGFYGMPPVVEALAWFRGRPGGPPSTVTGCHARALRSPSRERPHPGAQLRLTDHEGWRITCCTTNTRGRGRTLAALEVRHRQRARAEDRIRARKDAGLRNLPFHGFVQNQIWLEIVALAADLLAWVGILRSWPGPTSPPARWEPKRLRFRPLAVAGRMIHSGRRRRLHHEPVRSMNCFSCADGSPKRVGLPKAYALAHSRSLRSAPCTEFRVAST